MNRMTLTLRDRNWHEPLALEFRCGQNDVAGIGNGATRQKEMDRAFAQEAIELFVTDTAPDLTLSRRAVVVLAGLLSLADWITITDLQIELENRSVFIPLASLYPLLDRLVRLRFVARENEEGGRGRPKAHYAITDAGRRAVSLARFVAKSL